MAIDEKIKDENLRHDINREAAKISALSSDKLTNMNTLQMKVFLSLLILFLIIH